MRPTRQHIPLSPTRLIRDALAVHPKLQRLGDQRVDPCFHWPFCIDMSTSETPGFFVDCSYPVLRRRRWPSTLGESLSFPRHTLHPPIPVKEKDFGLTYGSLSLQPVVLLALPSELTRLASSHRGRLNIRASDGLVTRAVAEYDYSANWVICTDGTLTR